LFTISDDQRDLVAMVAEVAANTITPYAVESDRAHHFPADVLRKAADFHRILEGTDEVMRLIVSRDLFGRSA
jgi:alkylation response protein AidB-like acyl-CoA dehydrogenase